MSISTDNSGVACCGNCGGHVVVACSRGCPEPDVEFRANYIARLKKPAGRQSVGPRYPTGRKAIPGICTYRACQDPIAPQDTARKRGRQHTKCETHLALTRKWSATQSAKKVTS